MCTSMSNVARRKTEDEETVMVGARFAKSIVAGLDAAARERERLNPGIPFSRVDSLRAAVAMFLESEAKAKREMRR